MVWDPRWTNLEPLMQPPPLGRARRHCSWYHHCQSLSLVSCLCRQTHFACLLVCRAVHGWGEAKAPKKRQKFRTYNQSPGPKVKLPKRESTSTRHSTNFKFGKEERRFPHTPNWCHVTFLTWDWRDRTFQPPKSCWNRDDKANHQPHLSTVGCSPSDAGDKGEGCLLRT